MAQYIDKNALVAEIESKIKKYAKRGEESDTKCDGYGMYWGGVISCLIEIRALCDTFEMKEVDLEREIKRYRMRNPIIQHREESLYGYMANVAKHFYELGLKVQKGK